MLITATARMCLTVFIHYAEHVQPVCAAMGETTLLLQRDEEKEKEEERSKVKQRLTNRWSESLSHPDLLIDPPVHIHRRTSAFKHMHAHARTHTHTHARKHTHTHTHSVTAAC